MLTFPQKYFIYIFPVRYTSQAYFLRDKKKMWEKKLKGQTAGWGLEHQINPTSGSCRNYFRSLSCLYWVEKKNRISIWLEIERPFQLNTFHQWQKWMTKTNISLLATIYSFNQKSTWCPVFQIKGPSFERNLSHNNWIQFVQEFTDFFPIVVIHKSADFIFGRKSYHYLFMFPFLWCSSKSTN